MRLCGTKAVLISLRKARWGQNGMAALKVFSWNFWKAAVCIGECFCPCSARRRSVSCGFWQLLRAVCAAQVRRSSVFMCCPWAEEPTEVWNVCSVSKTTQCYSWKEQMGSVHPLTNNRRNWGWTEWAGWCEWPVGVWEMGKCMWDKGHPEKK